MRWVSRAEGRNRHDRRRMGFRASDHKDVIASMMLHPYWLQTQLMDVDTDETVVAAKLRLRRLRNARKAAR